MLVEDNRKFNSTIRFAELDFGDVFTSDFKIYMKISGCYQDAVCVSTGATCTFNSTDEVHLLEHAGLVIND